MSKRNNVVPAEWLANIEGREHRCRVDHWPDEAEEVAVVTVLGGPLQGRKFVVPRGLLRVDGSELPPANPDDVPGQGRFPWA